MDYGIRWARPDEWEQVMEMIWETFQKFDAPDCEPEGRQSFYDFIMDEHLKESFLAGNYKLLVAVDGDEIIGAGSLRNVNHISLLFVKEEYHLQGVGSALVQMLCDYLQIVVGEHYVSLMASPYAVDFYKKLGFSLVKARSMKTGIPVAFMEKVF
ncbi:MAG: GNAT family N-acetyltransferase [Lachnospiraceae bacterium]|jgi:GNAT superfamily N-acetyltransferase|nr:GNAT family N-acetyltransferase [Lachnospiraceae bacterium]MBP5264968.1 GNAT family N-acetyltransferase [Lachnospiraceae bacterium]MBR3469705.1 GNAT family N-acetyltransferase [Lachnospiraceae bacterium]MCR5500070.1 GNAT family N-acetyltransferase [Acetatifactor sp.]